MALFFRWQLANRKLELLRSRALYKCEVLLLYREAMGCRCGCIGFDAAVRSDAVGDG